MRFKRSDLPGLIIASVPPPLLFLLFLQSFEVWDHRGTPLLGFMAVNFALAAGGLAMFSRFVRNWDIPLALTALLAIAVTLIIWLQRMGYDRTPIATTLKWVSVLDFFALNLVLGLQVITNGLLPILDRRDRRRAQQRQ